LLGNPTTVPLNLEILKNFILESRRELLALLVEDNKLQFTQDLPLGVVPYCAKTSKTCKSHRIQTSYLWGKVMQDIISKSKCWQI
jgi:hypothetical protein